MSKTLPNQTLVQNRKAYHNYFIEEELVAGIKLLGSEIKSLRNGKASIEEAYIDINKNSEAFLLNAHISPYALANRFNHEPLRKRKLLLHKKEIKNITGKINLKGYTAIPLKIFLNNRNIAKVKIGIAKGKKLYDKRASIKAKEWKRERQRELKIKNK
jgi:SsrA-binding protein